MLEYVHHILIGMANATTDYLKYGPLQVVGLNTRVLYFKYIQVLAVMIASPNINHIRPLSFQVRFVNV